MKYVPDTTKLGFMKMRMPSFLFSMAAIAVSIVLILTQGLNLGIDFKGGATIETAKPAGVEIEDVRGYLGNLGLGELTINEATGTGVNAEPVIVIKVATQDATEAVDEEAATQAATDTILNKLEEEFGLPQDEFLKQRETIGPKVSGELFRSGIIALGVALVLMLAYISFRFRWHFALGAVAALVHDVILTIGVFSGLQLEFNLSTIAALLTIVGYSMNDTVVVFDRVREFMGIYTGMSKEEIINKAINSTVSRTVITSLTTMFVVLILFVFGGGSIKGFAFALLIGIIVGTYSSIFVATPIMSDSMGELKSREKTTTRKSFSDRAKAARPVNEG